MSSDAVFHRIVVPTDFSSCAEGAWALAQRLAAVMRSELLLIHVIAGQNLLTEATRRWATDELEECAAKARAQGLKVHVVLRAGMPYQEIVALAQNERADLIIIGHGRRGTDRGLPGSVAHRLLDLAPCPVLTVREPA